VGSVRSDIYHKKAVGLKEEKWTILVAIPTRVEGGQSFCSGVKTPIKTLFYLKRGAWVLSAGCELHPSAFHCGLRYLQECVFSSAPFKDAYTCGSMFAKIGISPRSTQAMPYMQTKRSVEIADPRMDGGYNIPSLQLFCALATTCLHGDPLRRPTMSEVRHTLEQIGKHAVRGVNALTVHVDGPKLGLAITPDWDLMSTLSTSETWGELRSNSSDSGLQDEYSEGGLGSKERPSALSSLGSSAWSGPITMLQPR
jgi:hypothetical protein